MEDDHVDRPGVEVRQRMKLTGTNSSIGLIVLIDYAHRTSFDKPDLLSSRAKGAADGAPNDWRRALRLRPLAEAASRKVRRVQKQAKACQLLTQVALR